MLFVCVVVDSHLVWHLCLSTRSLRLLCVAMRCLAEYSTLVSLNARCGLQKALTDVNKLYDVGSIRYYQSLQPSAPDKLCTLSIGQSCVTTGRVCTQRLK